MEHELKIIVTFDDKQPFKKPVVNITFDNIKIEMVQDLKLHAIPDDTRMEFEFLDLESNKPNNLIDGTIEETNKYINLLKQIPGISIIMKQFWK